MLGKITAVTLIAVGLILTGCGKEHDHDHDPGHNEKDDGHGHDHDHEAKHGGSVIALEGEVAHVEFVHDAKAGKATLYITGKDAKEALALVEAPILKLKTADGQKILVTDAENEKDGKASQYSLTHDALKTEPVEGRISIKLNGKEYNPSITDSHDHGDHDGHDHGHDHKGHDHDEGHDNKKEESHDHHGHDHDHDH